MYCGQISRNSPTHQNVHWCQECLSNNWNNKCSVLFFFMLNFFFCSIISHNISYFGYVSWVDVEKSHLCPWQQALYDLCSKGYFFVFPWNLYSHLHVWIRLIKETSFFLKENDNIQFCHTTCHDNEEFIYKSDAMTTKNLFTKEMKVATSLKTNPGIWALPNIRKHSA